MNNRSDDTRHFLYRFGFASLVSIEMYLTGLLGWYTV